MNWKQQLKKMEDAQQWDDAIAFVQQVIKNHPDELDAYLFMNYLLMNLLVEEDHDESKHDYYEYLTKKNFDESYKKFSHDPEYLFYIGITAIISPWYWGIEMEDCEKMFNDALQLDPTNILYHWSQTGYKLTKENYEYAKKILNPNSPLPKMLESKGSMGEYIYGMMTHWAPRFIKEYEKHVS